MKSIYGLMLGFCLIINQAWAANIVVFGDSISAAYGLEVNKGWVVKLQHKLTQQKNNQYSVINASVSGETTTGGLTRLPMVLKQHQPKVLILELGGNDGLRGQSPKLMQQNLQAMIKQAKQQKVTVLLLGMKIPPNYGKAYTQAFEKVFAQVAKQQKVAFVPFFLEGVGGNNQLMQADNIHPNAQAQDKLVQNVWVQLQELL
ncbi:MAG: arylesterase [Moraxellaceae bacterium]|nr:arylesterase [Moraxellaceae bacterium]